MGDGGVACAPLQPVMERLVLAPRKPFRPMRKRGEPAPHKGSWRRGRCKMGSSVVSDNKRRKGEVEQKDSRSKKRESQKAGSSRIQKVELEKGELTPDKWRKGEREAKSEHSPDDTYQRKEGGRSENDHRRRPSSKQDSNNAYARDAKGGSKHESSNGKVREKEHNSVGFPKIPYSPEFESRNHKQQYPEIADSKSRRKSEEHNSSSYAERSHRNASSSAARPSATGRYSSSSTSRPISSYRDRSPNHFDRSPHERSRHRDYKDRTPGCRDRTPPHERELRFRDRSRSPLHDRESRYRDRSPAHDRESGKKRKGGERQQQSNKREERPVIRDDKDSLKNSYSVKQSNKSSSSRVWMKKPTRRRCRTVQAVSLVSFLLPLRRHYRLHLPLQTFLHRHLHHSHLFKLMDRFLKSHHQWRKIWISATLLPFNLKRLMDEGFIQSDHLIKHGDTDRWVTVENATSPLVPTIVPSVDSDVVTRMVSPPEASGNLLGEVEELSQEAPNLTSDRQELHMEDASVALDELGDFHIDARVQALLNGHTIVDGKELESLGEALNTTLEPANLQNWSQSEGYSRFQVHSYDSSRHPRDEGIKGGGPGNFSTEPNEVQTIAPSLVEKGCALVSAGSTDWFSGRWSCKGGDWKRNDEVGQDRCFRRKLVLNEGYPLCEMPKGVHEDPRILKKDDLYHPLHVKKLDLPSWAFSSTEENIDSTSETSKGVVRALRE
uniref:ATXR3 GYF domain-containing protein n=1 Tax=Ananas comosus var. bracteatus TaxID=296719 RepID=A0A6V7QVI8_ANACO